MNKNKNSKIMLVLSILLLFLIIGSASATDETSNEKVSTTTNDDGVDTLNTEVGSVDEKASAADNLGSSDASKDSTLESTNNELLSENPVNWTVLKNEITGKESVTLSHEYYKYVTGDENQINLTGIKVLDGNGATIDADNQDNIRPFQSNGNITIKNIHFINVKQTTTPDKNFRGGPILFEDECSNIILEQCTFSNLTTSVVNTAGAIGICGCDNVTIKNCKFYDNNYFNSLVISYPTRSDNITVENCQFYNNTAKNSNGLFYFQNVYNLTIKNCNFTNESSKHRLVGIIGGSNATVTKCNFNNCTVSPNGAGYPSAVYMGASYSTLSDCNITDCKSTGNYDFNGAVYWTGSYGKIYNVNFTNCYSNASKGRGGAITLNGKYNEINDCTFNHCSAGDNGGAISLYQPMNNVSRCTFNDCSAVYGGAIFDGYGYGNIADCTFNNCNASRRGSAVASTGSFSTISRCNFNNCINTNNETPDNYYGGAVNFNQNGNIVKDSVFTDCTSIYKNGGAIVYYGTSGIIDNCTFNNNNAGQYGDGIYSINSELNISNSKFNNNGKEALNINGGSYYLKNNTGLTESNKNISDNAVSWEEHDFYISLNGTGNGTINDPANLTYAYQHIASGYTIHFTQDINDTTKLYTSNQINLYKPDICIDGHGYTINANGKSFAFNLAGDNITIKNLNFNDFIHGTYVSPVSFVSFSNNCRVYNCNFTKCRTTGWGGAIIIGWTSQIIVIHPTIDKCNFEYCEAGAGACIYTKAHTASNIIQYLTISNCNASNSKLTTAARGSFIEVNAQYTTIVKCTLENMSAGDGSGAIGLFNNAPNTDIINCTFKNCTSNKQGGAISSESTVNQYVTIAGCSFIGNSAPKGGAIDTVNQYCDISDCTFINNTATTGAAGAVNFGAANSNIVNCDFINNSAKTSSGAVQFSGQSSSIKDSTFTNNTAGTSAGAVTFSGSNSLISGSTFINNTALADAGSVLFTGSNSNIQSSNFINNTAVNGGAISYNAQNCGLSDCNFTGNNATENGGAVQFKGTDCYISDCNFNNNTASVAGGAVYADAKGGQIISSNFTNNSAPSGKDAYASPKGTIQYIGLAFDEFYITNDDKAQTSVGTGSGQSVDNPVEWSGNLYTYFKKGSQITLYIVGSLDNFTMRNLNNNYSNVIQCR